ncbi:MAG: 30S ribosomal protein S4, partial [Bryobacterales bacterium]|nr:30S ribosomal protein S4 [Bryobacterales bacterium]
IPSFLTKKDDVIEVRAKSKQNAGILASCDATASRPAPTWLEFDRDNLRGRVTGQFKRDELVQIQLNEQLIVELYSK